MAEVIGEIIDGILNVSTFSWWVAGTLAVSGAIFVLSMSSIVWLSAVAGTFSLFGALTGIYAFDVLGIYIGPDKAVQTVLAATAGVLPTMLLLLFVRLIYTVHALVQPSIPPGPVKLPSLMKPSGKR